MRRPLSLAALALCSTTIAITAPASAQDDGESQWQFAGRMGDDMSMWGLSDPRPPIRDLQLDHYIAILGLDDTQKALAHELHTAYAQEHLREWLTYAEANSDARSSAMLTQDWQAMQTDQATRSAQWRDTTQRATESFLNDLRLLLSADQETNWEAFERGRRREQMLPKLATSGPQAVDLVQLTSTLDLSEAELAELKPLLDHYTAELDEALIPFTTKAAALDKTIDDFEKAQAEMATAWSGDEQDMDKVMKAQEDFGKRQADVTSEALALRADVQRVLDIQRRHTKLILEAIPSTARDDYERATSKRATGRDIFSAITYSRYKQAVTTLENIDAMRSAWTVQAEAVGFGDQIAGALDIMSNTEPLSDDQKDDIAQITERYDAAIEALDRNAARDDDPAGDDADEPSQISIPTERGIVSLYKYDEADFGVARFAGTAGDDPEQQKERAEIEQNAIDELRGVLTFYQRAMIAQN